MEIYVVQPGDTIYAIADKYGVSAVKLIMDNELDDPNNLVPGQTIVIVYPAQTHIVQNGDSIDGIAKTYGVTTMQLLRNNPFLLGREYIYQGETLTISYSTLGKITTNGFAFPFIGKETLIKTLPYLTYLSIYNYKLDSKGNITAFYDDIEIIRFSKQYEVIPLMSISSLSEQGEINIEAAYDILLDDNAQEQLIENALNIMRTKGYSGVNIAFNFLNATTQKLYEKFLAKIYIKSRQEGYSVFVTINLASKKMQEAFEKIDYSVFARLSDNLIFMHYVWGINYGPPLPVASISTIKSLLDYVTTNVSADIINIGFPTIGYDWELPYIPGKSNAHSLSLNAAVSLARDTGALIQFDDNSQTPFFQYLQFGFGNPVQHIVWFIDARSFDALVKLVSEYRLAGTGVWNIMIYYSQLWLVINSQYDIEKFIE